MLWVYPISTYKKFEIKKKKKKPMGPCTKSLDLFLKNNNKKCYGLIQYPYTQSWSFLRIFFFLNVMGLSNIFLHKVGNIKYKLY